MEQRKHINETSYGYPQKNYQNMLNLDWWVDLDSICHLVLVNKCRDEKKMGGWGKLSVNIKFQWNVSSKCHEDKSIFILFMFTSVLKIDWHVRRSKYTALCHQNKTDNIGGVMIIVIASSVVDDWFNPWSGQARND